MRASRCPLSQSNTYGVRSLVYAVFLMQSYLGYAIVRWQNFISIGYRIQGRYHP